MPEVVGELTLHRYSQTVSQVVQLGNQYIDVQAPWALRKTDPERMATVLWVLLEAMRMYSSKPVLQEQACIALQSILSGDSRAECAAVTKERDEARARLKASKHKSAQLRKKRRAKKRS